jgi:GWxTD domain-containing protein
MHLLRIVLIGGLLLPVLGLQQNLPAQGVESIDMVRSRFFIDHASFADGDSNRLEVYYKVFNDGLNYVKKGDKYVANYEVNVIVLGEGEQQVNGISVDKTYVLNDYELTQSQEGYLVNQVELRVEPGKYALFCKLIDHNSNDVSNIESEVRSPRFDPDADISEIELLQEAGEQLQESKFTKRGLTTVPSVERTFDSETQPLGFYVELYVGEHPGEELLLEYNIRGSNGNHTQKDTVVVDVDSSVIGRSHYVSLENLPPGEYDLMLTLKSGNRQLAERRTGFNIKWSLPSLIKNDFDYAVEQLKYVHTPDERDELKEAPESLRVQKFEELWKSKDPTPTTPRNELREEYYRRIRYANQYFRAINRDGWQTDRGMVYIKYGEPDQIDRHPFEMGRKPYQIWYYYTQRRTFVFEDTRGDGDYQLLYPYDGDYRHYIGR